MDGKQAGQGKIERTIPVRFSLDETMDVGQDTGTPVIEEYVNRMPFAFTGTLEKVVVVPGRSGLATGDEKKVQEGERRARSAGE